MLGIPKSWLIGALAAAFIAATGLAGWKGYALGRDGERAYWLAKEAATAVAVAKANDDAKREEAVIVADLRSRISDLTRNLRDNDEAALRDPNANHLGIGADSVRRLNLVRASKAGGSR